MLLQQLSMHSAATGVSLQQPCYALTQVRDTLGALAQRAAACNLPGSGGELHLSRLKTGHSKPLSTKSIVSYTPAWVKSQVGHSLRWGTTLHPCVAQVSGGAQAQLCHKPKGARPCASCCARWSGGAVHMEACTLLVRGGDCMQLLLLQIWLSHHVPVTGTSNIR